MGNFCCGKKDDTEQVVKVEPTKCRPLEQYSSPSNVPTAELTDVYEIPNNEFETVEQVVKSHGYELLEEIGKGGYAVVYKAKRVKDDSLVACKRMGLNGSKGENSRLKVDAKNELFVMRKISHPHIVRLFEHFIIKTAEENSVYIFMQFAEGKCLSEVIRENRKPFDEKSAKRMFAQMVSAVDHMHSKGIAHRDLKMGNILFDKNANVLVSDFGLSRVIIRSSKPLLLSNKYCGTMHYMAPEIVSTKMENNNYNPFDADIWALGIILYVIINFGYPYNKDLPIKDYYNELMTRQLKYSKHIISDPSNSLDNILRNLLQPKVEKRIKMKELVNHIWIRDLVKQIAKKVK